MTDQPLTRHDLEEILDIKLDQKLDQKFGAFRQEIFQRLDEQAEATADLADMVSARFDQVDERLDRLEKRADSTERILAASIRRVDQHDAIIGYNVQLKNLKPLPAT